MLCILSLATGLILGCSPSSTNTKVTSPVSQPPLEPKAELERADVNPLPKLPEFSSSLGIELPNTEDSVVLLNFASKTDELAQRAFAEINSLGKDGYRDRMLALSRLKQQAAERVIQGKTVPPEALKRAKQIKLEALSQQAGLQDTSASQALEAYATELLASTDPTLQFNSRVVKLGFLVERLVAGMLPEPKDLEKAVADLCSVPPLIDLPAAMSLQHAHSTLLQYGYDGSALRVRDLVIKALKVSNSPSIQRIAIDLEGHERFDEPNRLFRELAEGRDVKSKELAAVLERIATKHPDEITLEYLKHAVLNFESSGRESFANALSQVMAAALTKPSKSSQGPETNAREVVEDAIGFLEARNRRQQLIGQALEISGADLVGVPIDWSLYRKSVVLIPFWTMENEASMQSLLTLQKLGQELGDQVRVLGVNLDAGQSTAPAFVQQARLQFPSLAQRDLNLQGLRDPLAVQAGVASLPYVLVVDADGKVAAVILDLSKAEGIVKNVLAKSSR
jgi:hypothetical protein